MNKKYLLIISISILTFCLGFMLSKKYDDAISSEVADLKISHTCLACNKLKVKAENHGDGSGEHIGSIHNQLTLRIKP